MATIFLGINSDSHLLEHLAYNSETKVFTVLTGIVGDWKKNFNAPKSQSTTLLLKAFTLTHHQKTERVSAKFSSKNFMTYEFNLKCIWQHPTTGNHLVITKSVCGEVGKPIIITVRSLRQTQPRTWKKPIKQDTEDLINLLSSLVKFTKFLFFNKLHTLQKQLVEELILFCQSLSLSTR